MFESLIACAVLIACAGILYGCDVATFAFLANPDPARSLSVQLLSWLSLVVVIGLYGATMALLTAVIVSAYSQIGILTGTHWKPNRAVIALGIFCGLAVAALVRRFIKGVAGKRDYPRADRAFPHHAGASLPWFVAMQYYALMLNRTYKVFITDAMLCGAKVRGLTASPPTPQEDQIRPEDWVGTLEASLYERLDVTSAGFVRMNFANFQIPWKDVDRIDFSTAPKWGMGNVPYSGRIFHRLRSGRSKEFILLGQQNGPAIKEELEKAMAFRDLH